MPSRRRPVGPASASSPGLSVAARARRHGVSSVSGVRGAGRVFRVSSAPRGVYRGDCVGLRAWRLLAKAAPSCRED